MCGRVMCARDFLMRGENFLERLKSVSGEISSTFRQASLITIKPWLFIAQSHIWWVFHWEFMELISRKLLRIYHFVTNCRFGLAWWAIRFGIERTSSRRLFLGNFSFDTLCANSLRIVYETRSRTRSSCNVKRAKCVHVKRRTAPSRSE
jgi:hypothetical protein